MVEAESYTFNGSNWLIAQPEKAPITWKYIKIIKSFISIIKWVFTKKYFLYWKWKWINKWKFYKRNFNEDLFTTKNWFKVFSNKIAKYWDSVLVAWYKYYYMNAIYLWEAKYEKWNYFILRNWRQVFVDKISYIDCRKRYIRAKDYIMWTYK